MTTVNNKKYKKVKDHPFFGMLKDSNVSVSSNAKHFKPIKRLKLRSFKP